MAKKSSATRHSTAQRRPQTSKAPDVALVRTPKPGGEQKTAAPATVSTPAASPRTGGAKTAPVQAQAAKTAPKPAAMHAIERPKAPEVAKSKPVNGSRPQVQPRPPQPQQPSGGSAAARAQAARVARAKALQRARAANFVTPEHYSYVIRDLKLIAVLACLMFATLIVLHFVLPQ